MGPSVKLAYVDQSRQSLDDKNTVWQEISGGLDMIKVGNYETPSRGYVGRFNFKGTGQQQIIGELSGGERNRVHLAKVLKSGGNVLMLDEPTNDLDVETLRALEEALLAFPGCAVVISHDRWFLDRIATHILAFEGNSRGRMVRGQLPGLHGRPEAAQGRRSHPAASHQVQAADQIGARSMAMATNVFIDSTGTMYFGDERETARNCPHCHAFSRMSPQAMPTFDELLLQKPRTIGVVLRCHACNAPVFLRYATRAFASNRVELVAAGVRRRTPGREVRVQLRARGRRDLLPRGADLLLAQPVPGIRVHVPAHRRP